MRIINVSHHFAIHYYWVRLSNEMWEGIERIFHDFPMHWHSFCLWWCWEESHWETRDILTWLGLQVKVAVLTGDIFTVPFHSTTWDQNFVYVIVWWLNLTPQTLIIFQAVLTCKLSKLINLKFCKLIACLKRSERQEVHNMARCSIGPGSNWLMQSSGWDKIWPVVHNFKRMCKIHWMSMTSSCCWNATEPSKIWAQGQTAGRAIQPNYVNTWHDLLFVWILTSFQPNQLSLSHPISLPLTFHFVSACSVSLFLFCSRCLGTSHCGADTGWFSVGLWVKFHFHLESWWIGGETKIAKSQWLNFTLYFHLGHHGFLQLE